MARAPLLLPLPFQGDGQTDAVPAQLGAPALQTAGAGDRALLAAPPVPPAPVVAGKTLQSRVGGEAENLATT